MKKKITIFFSWATEHPENKKFILEMLDIVKKKLVDISIEAIIQESTSDVEGYVRIDDVIDLRISKCDFFIADLSPIGTLNSGKLVVNPNVCYEVGYMLGNHGDSRVFGFYNEETVVNPSVELPFDFNHRRATRFKINKDAEAKIKNMNKYADMIVNSILNYDNNGNLNSNCPLKKHDIDINEYISDNMENFKYLVCDGPFENFEKFGENQYDFLYEFMIELEKKKNEFHNSSLEVIRKQLLKSLIDFKAFQNCHTFYLINKFTKCTERYFILNHPRRCSELGYPVIIDENENDYRLDKYNEVSDKYRELALQLIDAYENLEKRFIDLTE